MTSFIRKARRKDRQAINDVNRLCLPVGYSIDEWERMINHGLSVVAVKKTQVIGYVVVTPEEKSEDTVCIVSVALLPEYRGLGLGHKMLTMCLDLIQGIHCRQVVLRVQTGNVSAIKLYQRNGFEIAQTLKDYYRGSLGTGDTNYDAYQMVLKFPRIDLKMS